jgi:hypothetical protein
MSRTIRHSTLLVIVFCVTQASIGRPIKASQEEERTLVGEWIVRSTPIDGKMSSPKGITLGFPDRDMVFEEQGEIRTGVVLREDVGHDVRPLGVWRVMGNDFSTTFQLWCPDAEGPCGSIVMRGSFVREDKISGTMTAFFDVEDASTPTGFDTWTFAFAGNRVAPGSGGSQ